MKVGVVGRRQIVLNPIMNKPFSNIQSFSFFLQLVRKTIYEKYEKV